MCRWAAYCGEPLFLEDIVSSPAHSLIAQSHSATEARTATNGDGFGIAWYGERETPGLYRDVLPAWSDCNLKSIARQIRSPLFLAHVRAATSGGTRRDNCHPFVHGRWSFMHNGQIGGYEQFRRAGEMLIPDALYPQRKGATDSEALFLLAVAEGLEAGPRAALERAAAQFIRLSREKGTTPHLRMTAALSDGQRLFAVRYATDDAAPSLWHRWSDTRGGRAVVSEPLEADEADWQEIPPASFCTFDGEAVTVEPFLPCRLALAAA